MMTFFLMKSRNQWKDSLAGWKKRQSVHWAAVPKINPCAFYCWAHTMGAVIHSLWDYPISSFPFYGININLSLWKCKVASEYMCILSKTTDGAQLLLKIFYANSVRWTTAVTTCQRNVSRMTTCDWFSLPTLYTNKHLYNFHLERRNALFSYFHRGAKEKAFCLEPSWFGSATGN